MVSLPEIPSPETQGKCNMIFSDKQKKELSGWGSD